MPMTIVSELLMTCYETGNEQSKAEKRREISVSVQADSSTHSVVGRGLYGNVFKTDLSEP